jgi:hypothetical protein
MTYHWTETFKSIWENAVLRYRVNGCTAANLLTEKENAFIASIGQNAQEMYDYVDDFVRYPDGPTFECVLAVAQVRLSYFLNVQNGVASTLKIDPDTLPAKTAELKGIAWLPRLIAKAQAKLKGELDPDVMYGCGGDRNFFKKYNIHPATFLEKTRIHFDDPEAIADWVIERQKE